MLDGNTNKHEQNTAEIGCLEGVRVVDLGGAAGAEDDAGGLDFFKRGFATRSERNFLCGHVLDPERYDALCDAHGRSAEWFPAYRSSEGAGDGGAP